MLRIVRSVPFVLALAATSAAAEDRMLTYSTTFGRGGGEVREVAVDSDGNIVIAGSTTERFNFPLVNAVDDTFGEEGREGFVAKISAAGDELIYSTYLGGDGDDWVTGVAVDAAGNAYIVGTTLALDFPTFNALQPLANVDDFGFVRDGFVTKLDPDGDFVWSTYLGGEGNEEAHDVAVGAGGAVYVVGETQSEDFPSVAGFQPTCKLSAVFMSCYDAFITKLAGDGQSLEFSTFLGGTAGGIGESGCGVAVDGFGNVYVIGENRSDDFPLQSPFQGARGGGVNDLFVAKLAAAGNALLWSSHLGGSGDEVSCSVLARGPSIALNSQGDAFVSLSTRSEDMTVIGGFQGGFAGATDAYVAKVTNDGLLEWASYLGGDGSESAANVAVNGSGSPTVVGSTTSKTFPLTANALPEAGCPLAQTPLCPFDGFVSEIAPDGSSLRFSSFLGTSELDQISGVDVDAAGSIYVAGFTRGNDWPLIEPLPAAFRGAGVDEQFVTRIGLVIEEIPGDANGDGAVTAGDALAALNVAIGTGACALCICDINNDGSITASDALGILSLAVGLEVPINTPPC